MNRQHKLTIAVSLTTGLVLSGGVQADVVHRQINAENLIVHVSDEAWQPEGFRNGTTVPAAHVYAPAIVIDGKADEAAWNRWHGSSERQQMLDAIRPFLLNDEKFTVLRQLIFQREQSAA